MAKTALIVDDMAFVRKTLSTLLSQAHYQVIGEAADGAEAVKLYTKLRPDFVTMDIVMPMLSGIEATRKIIATDKEARIIIISAMSQENLIMEAIHAGAKDFIQKPFNKTEVIKTIERALKDPAGSL